MAELWETLVQERQKPKELWEHLVGERSLAGDQYGSQQPREGFLQAQPDVPESVDLSTTATPGYVLDQSGQYVPAPVKQDSRANIAQAYAQSPTGFLEGLKQPSAEAFGINPVQAGVMTAGRALREAPLPLDIGEQLGATIESGVVGRTTVGDLAGSAVDVLNFWPAAYGYRGAGALASGMAKNVARQFPKGAKVPVVQYGDIPAGETALRANFGTGIKSEEAGRVAGEADLSERLSLYGRGSDYVKEAGLPSTGATATARNVLQPGKEMTKLYKQAHGMVLEQSKIEAAGRWAPSAPKTEVANQFERLLQEKGYRGYQGNNSTITYFDDLPIEQRFTGAEPAMQKSLSGRYADWRAENQATARQPGPYGSLTAQTGAAGDIKGPAALRSTAHTRAGAGVEELRQRIPPSERVQGRSWDAKGKPIRTVGGVKYKDLDLTAPGGGTGNITQDEINAIWDEAIAGSPEVAKEVLTKTGANPRDIAFWNRSLALPDRARYWYEISTESMKDELSFLTDAELSKFFDIVAATSPQADPNINMMRALSLIGHEMAGTPATTAISAVPGTGGGVVRKAISGVDSETNKVHNFGGTFDYLAGYQKHPPLSTNDRQVASTFGISDTDLFSSQSMYEPISRFYIGLAKRLNKDLPVGAEPYQPWQLQAMGWVEERIGKGNTNFDDYMMAIDKIKGGLVEAGLMKPGDKLSRKIVSTPGFQRIVDKTTKQFESAPITTVEAMSEKSPETARLLGMRDQWDEITTKRVDAVVRRSMNAITQRDAKKGKKSLAERALAVSRGISSIGGRSSGIPKANITRIDYGQGTFQGNFNQNMRIPLINTTQDEQEIFLALFNKGMNQDVSPASRFLSTTHTAPSKKGATRTYSLWMKGKYEVDQGEVKALLAELDEGVEVSITSLPNGTMLDIVPKFGDSGPVPLLLQDVKDAADFAIAGKFDIKPRDFSSVAAFRGDDKALLDKFKRMVDTKTVDEMHEVAPMLTRQQLRAYLKGDSDEPISTYKVLKKNGEASDRTTSSNRVGRLARIKGQRLGLRRDFDGVRKEFEGVLSRQEKEIGALANRLEKLSNRTRK